MATASRISVEAFLAMKNDEKPYLEYACGEVFRKPMPTFGHSAIQIFLGSALLSFLARTRLGRALTEFRCIFGPPGRVRAYVPDLVYVANERLTGDRYLRAA